MRQARAAWLAARAVGMILALGPVMAGAQAPGDRLPSSHPVVVREANGARLGIVVGPAAPGTVVVWHQRAGLNLASEFEPDGLAPSSSTTPIGAVVYESSDCSGPALILDVTRSIFGVSSLFDVSAVGPGRQLLGAAGPPTTVNIGSLWGLGEEVCEAALAPTALSVSPTVLLLDPASLALPLQLH